MSVLGMKSLDCLSEHEVQVQHACHGKYVCMYVCLFNVLGTNRGPTDKVLFMQIHLAKMLLLREKQFLMNPPHAFASQLSKKSDTEQAH